MSARAPIIGVSTCLFAGSRVLLVKRGAGAYRGLWSLPGGRVEFGERLEDAARREVLEESGIISGRLKFLLLHEAIESSQEIHAVIAVHVGSVGLEAEPHPGDDASEARFFEPSEVVRIATTPGLLGVVRQAACAV